jgi:glycopeptide antibiotics resistance protein
VLVSVVVLVPLGLVAAHRLAARARSRGVPARPAARRALATAGVVVGTVPWLVLILTPLDAAQDLRLVPLRDLAEILADRPLTAFFQIVGNLLVFAAFGFCAGIGWPVRLATVVAGAAAMSVTVETLQFVLALGRVSSSDDVLLNAAGAGLALLAARRLAVAA